MKILHLISSGGMYGAEAVILNLSEKLRAEGHESSLGVLAVPTKGHLQLHEAAGQQGIASHLIACQGPLDRAVPRRIRALLESTGADLVHTHGYKVDVYGYAALRQTGVALVSTCHTWYDNDLALRFYGAVDRWVLRRFAQVAAVSQEVRQRLLQAGVQPGKVKLIRNGIDPEPFRSASPSLAPARGVPLVGLVGRLSPEKGVDLFLRAAAKVRQTLPETAFVVAGEGPDRAMLEALIGKLHLGNHATLAGRRDDMASVYASLSVLVSASRQEGMPVTLLEAMASGLAIVATDAGEVPDLIVDGATGLLVRRQADAEQIVDELTAAVVRLLQSEDQRRSLGRAARQRVLDEFSADRMAADYLGMYREALGQARA